jgi:hypothetical protein
MKHGMSSSPEYNAYRAMLRRCGFYKTKTDPSYISRGITVCESWLGPNGFQNFFNAVGVRPSPDHSIDRVNNNGNYEPGNVRWATVKQQSRNRSNNHFVELNGQRKTVAEWSEELSIPRSRIIARLKRGWPVEKVLSVGIKKITVNRVLRLRCSRCHFFLAKLEIVDTSLSMKGVLKADFRCPKCAEKRQESSVLLTFKLAKRPNDSTASLEIFPETH